MAVVSWTKHRQDNQISCNVGSHRNLVYSDGRLVWGLSGDEIITANGNFKLVDTSVYLIGLTGSTLYVTNEGGYWEGTWARMRDECCFSYLEYVRSGRGGYAGLQTART